MSTIYDFPNAACIEVALGTFITEESNGAECDLKLKGETYGEIMGSVTETGRKNSIMVIAVEHEVISPGAASGLPTGRRHHKPITITKEVDRSSPLLYQMLVNNENITEWQLEFWQPSATGSEHQHYTVELVNAGISSIRFEMLNNKYPENVKH